MVIALYGRLLIVLLLVYVALGQEEDVKPHDNHVVDNNRSDSSIVVAGKSVNCDVSRMNYREFMTDDAQQRRENPYTSRYHSDGLPALPTCESPSENARGIYNSYLAPCEFAFHKSSTTEDAQGTSFQHLSTVCTGKNKMELLDSKPSILKHYVFGWKDECLASFPRCYSLSKQVDIFIGFVCRKKWEIPEGATHMSVDCTTDAKLKKERIAQMKNTSVMDDPYHQVHLKELKTGQQRWFELKVFIVSFVVLLALLCIGFSCCSYLCVIRPYLNLTLAAKKSELSDLIKRSEDDDVVTQGGGKALRRRVVAPNDV